MSVTTPFAAEKASLVLTCNFGTGCEPLFGSKTRTRPSQIVVRTRNRMTHLCFPGCFTCWLTKTSNCAGRKSPMRSR